MSAIEMIRGLVGYNYAFHERLWECIMQLTDEQFVAEIAYSHGSVRNHLVHTAGVDGRWLRGLQGDPEARSYDPQSSDYATRADVRQLWTTVSGDVKAYVDTLSEDDLLVVPPGMNEPRWQILTHIINHGTDHRAQVLRILHDFGAPTFPQDLIFYWWDAAR